MTAQPPKDYLRISEAVQYLRSQGAPVTESAIRRAARRGELPVYAIGRKHFFDRRALNKWIEVDCRVDAGGSNE